VTIHHFKKLEHIVIFRPTEEDLKIILSIYGSKLKHLEIIAAPFSLDFGEIVILCPQLVTLSLTVCNLRQSVFNLASGSVNSALCSVEIINGKRYFLVRETLRMEIIDWIILQPLTAASTAAPDAEPAFVEELKSDEQLHGT